MRKPQRGRPAAEPCCSECCKTICWSRSAGPCTDCIPDRQYRPSTPEYSRRASEPLESNPQLYICVVQCCRQYQETLATISSIDVLPQRRISGVDTKPARLEFLWQSVCQRIQAAFLGMENRPSVTLTSCVPLA